MNFFSIVNEDEDILPAIGAVDAELRDSGIKTPHVSKTFALGLIAGFLAITITKKLTRLDR